MMRIVALASACLALAGCAGRVPLVSTASLTVVEGVQGLPAPERVDLLAPTRASLIGPLDTLQVDVFGVPELSRQIQVDGSGLISFPLVGTLDAGGMTAPELANSIERGLVGRYIRNPQVTVNLRESVSQFVTVEGQVVEPGLYPVTNQMTLLRSIASARGLTEYARQDDVVIMRRVGGRRMAALYNMEAIRRGFYEDPPIYANDVVMVGDSPARRMFKDFASLAPLLASPVIAIIQ